MRNLWSKFKVIPPSSARYLIVFLLPPINLFLPLSPFLPLFRNLFLLQLPPFLPDQFLLLYRLLLLHA